MPKRKSRFPRLLGYMANSGGLFAAGFGAMLLVNAAWLAGPLILRRLVDIAIPARDEAQMLRLALLYLALVIVMGLLSYWQSVSIAKLGLGVVTRLKRDLFSHMLRLPVPYFDAHQVGELMARVENDSEKLRQFFSNVGIYLAGSCIFLAGMVGVMASIEPRATLYIMAPLPVLLVLIVFLFDKLRAWYEKARKLYAETVATITEFIQGIEVIRAFNRMRYAVDRTEAVSRRKRDLEMKAGIVEQGSMSLVGFIIGPVFTILIIKTLAPGILDGALSLGTLLVFLSYAQRLFEPLLAIADNIRGIQQARVAMDRIFGILDLGLEPEGSGGSAHFDREIEFRDVGFAYKEGEPVLQNVSFTIAKGETVALVGPSGSGKTTTVSLLCRFYAPSSGTILVDGRPLSGIDLGAWRRALGLVLQDVYLFPGSILENVRVYDDRLGEDEVLAALRTVHADAFVGRLKGGLAAELSERGGNVSSGEKQLVSFARAVAFNPELIVMDEATASVDVATERRIQESMAELLSGKTALIVAHRLSSILRADKIIFFKDGRIIAQGKHEDLIESLSDYAELVRLQFPDLVRGADASAAPSRERPLP